MNLFLEIISSVFIVAGVAFMIISVVGIIRLPDFYIRMSAITKAGTLGIGLILAGIGFYFNNPLLAGKVLIIILFMLLTSPVSAHIIARAAFKDRVPLWKKTFIDEYRPYLKQSNKAQPSNIPQEDIDDEN
jgi:multicomponent Na+:H+ antiporter subunit G